MTGLALAGVIAAAVNAAQVANAQEQQTESRELLRVDLIGVEGKEVTVSLIEIPPGAASGKHIHPGQLIVYVLEGAAIVDIEGRPPVTVVAGEVSYETPDQVMTVTNASATEPLRGLAINIGDKGQPRTIPLE